eukprot:4072204-Pyramimonas_sp.AAC.1
MPLKDFTTKIAAVGARFDSFLANFGHGQNCANQEYPMFFAALGYRRRQLLRQAPLPSRAPPRNERDILGLTCSQAFPLGLRCPEDGRRLVLVSLRWAGRG